jgi:hypothetical protein
MAAVVSSPTQASFTLKVTTTRSCSSSTSETLPTFTPAMRTSSSASMPAASLNSAL